VTESDISLGCLEIEHILIKFGRSDFWMPK
jgi:hypothetical protein